MRTFEFPVSKDSWYVIKRHFPPVKVCFSLNPDKTLYSGFSSLPFIFFFCCANLQLKKNTEQILNKINKPINRISIITLEHGLLLNP